MRNFMGFVIGIVVVTLFINQINVSSQVKQSALKSEASIQNASEAFLDKVADSGAITAKDYTQLSTALMSTGGTFTINITVSRLYPIPDSSEPGSYVMDYKPAYGWSTNKGGFPAEYQDPNWQNSTGAPAPRGVQYLVKGDNVSMDIVQVDAMDYQRSMVARLHHGTNLGNWSYGRAVRDTGNSIVGNQPEPMD
ncbi:hypothetical protein [Lysinibacillus xylanilyticus]|uniref:hypothetical protein n=1 Tax=Lysinibacillus xylanilyticus TaxID=582475 RepID=UPI0036DC89A7